MTKIESDPRWLQLQAGLACSCGETHKGMVDILVYWPEGWTHGKKIEDNRALRVKGDFLSEDFCVIDSKFFHIRGVLELPLKGAPHTFNFVCWSNLNSTDFQTYAEAAMNGRKPGEGKAFGRLMTNLYGYADTTYAMKLALHAVTKPGPLQRPRLVMEDDPHKLVSEQRQGIDLDRVFELYAANGHEMRNNFKTSKGLFGQKK